MAGVEQPLPRIKRCFACNNTDQTYDGRFFTFPKNLHRRIDWFKQLDVPSEIQATLMLTRLYVCAEHFDQGSITVGKIFPKKLMTCAVWGCDDGENHQLSMTTHRFPLEVQDCETWVRFSKNHYVTEQYTVHGSAGVRQWRMCNIHFERSCFKQPDTWSKMQNGAIPTLYAPSDEASIVNMLVAGQKRKCANELANDIRETAKGKKFIKATILPNRKLGSNTLLRARYNLGPEDLARRDKFYDFLLEDAHPPSRQKPAKAPCQCTCCSNVRTEGERKKTMLPFKVIQTADIGLQPQASPLPAKNVDSCRLCFATTKLEPLCCGMIVARNEMLDKIYICTGILIVPRPKVSIFICSPCGQLINSFHTYRQQVCSNNRAMTVNHSWARPEEAPKVGSYGKKVQTTPAIPVKKVPAGLVKRASNDPIGTPLTTPIRRQVAIPTRKILPMNVELVPSAESLLGIKQEPEDPLGGCGDPVPPSYPETTHLTKVVRKIRLPLPIQVKDEPLQMEVTEGSEILPQEELPDQASWKCWHCDEMFSFKFECAKHLLQVHREAVADITSRLNLDELNSNMLEMMSVHSKKPPPIAKRVKICQASNNDMI